MASTFDLDAPLASGSVLVKTVALSLDPYLRGRMRAPEIESYAPPFAVSLSFLVLERELLNVECHATARQALVKLWR